MHFNLKIAGYALVIAAVVYFFTLSVSAPLNDETLDGNNLSSNFLTRDDVTGTILFTGFKKTGSEQETSFPQVYLLNLSDAEPEHTMVSHSLFPSAAFAEFTDVLNPLRVFLYTLTNTSVFELNSVKHQVHFIDTLNDEVSYFDALADKNIQSTTWSEKAGLLAYHVTNEEKSSTTTTAENFKVEVFSPMQDEILISLNNAMQPQWSQDGSMLLFLRGDGLYAYDLAEKQESLVLGKDETDLNYDFIDANNKIEISPDGKSLVWASPAYQTIIVYSIASGSPLTLHEQHRITSENSEYYWPVFSPDSRFYVVQAIDSAVVPSFRTNPRLEVREVGRSEVLFTYPLNDFDFEALFTDDWIAKLPLL